MAEAQRVEFAGHDIEVRPLGNGAELQIDGKVHKVLRSDDGYNLEADAYAPPKPTLLEAAKTYVEKLAKKPE